MAAPIKSSKQSDILQTAKKLFWKHGIRRVSVEEICREAGASKMTFYRYFPNKIELVKTLLQRIFEEMMAEYHAIMQQDIPFEEKIRKQLLLKLKSSQGISAELIRDIYANRESGLWKQLERQNQEVQDALMRDLEEAQQKGWIRQDLQLDFIPFILKQIREWASDEQLLASYQSTQDLIMEITRFFFYGIMATEANTNEH